MSQYVTGTVAVTNGSTTVTGTGTSWSGAVSVGSIFVAPQGQGVPYVVAAVNSDTQITLASAYGGNTASGLTYSITTSYTPNQGLPYPEQGDLDTDAILKRAMLDMDTLLGTAVGSSTYANRLVYTDASGNLTTSANATFNGSTLTLAATVNLNGNVVIGDAAADTLTVNPNAVTWANNPTHSGNHTFSGNVMVNGNTTLGDASGDALTFNASTLAIPNGLNVDSNTLVIDATNDRVISGHSSSVTLSSLTPRVQVHGTTQSSSSASLVMWGAVQGSSVLSLAHSRSGAIGTHTALLVGDRLGSITFEGSDGSSWQNSAYIRSIATENWVAGTNEGAAVGIAGTANGKAVSNEVLVVGSSAVDVPCVGIGLTFDTATPILPGAILHVAYGGSSTNDQYSELRIQRGTNSAAAVPAITFRKNRGNSITTLSTILTGDDIGKLSFSGYVGSTGGWVKGAEIFVDEVGTVADTTTGLGMEFQFWTATVGGALTKQVAITDTGKLLAYNAAGGIGYGTGAGGTVTQTTSKSTSVTLNKPTGEITMHNAALAANTSVSFTLNNSVISSGDYLAVQHVSGGTAGAYNCTASCAAGSATITVRNLTSGSLSEAIVLKFVLFKAVTA